MSNFLLKIARFAERFHRAILLTTLIIVVLAIAMVTRVRFDPDVLSLLPQDDPAVKIFRDTLEEFGALDMLLMVVRVPENTSVLDPYQELVDELGASLQQQEEFEWVEYRIGEPTELLTAFFPQSFFFLQEDQREEIRSRLTDPQIDTKVAELRRRLSTPQAVALRELISLDPLGLSDVFLGQLDKGRGALGVDWTTGYYLSSDRRLFLMLAKPTGAAQDLEFTRHLVDVVEGAVAEKVEAWKAKHADSIAAGELPAAPEVAMGGGYLTALDDAELIRRDVLVNAFSSMGIVLLLFYFAFRRLGLLIYAFLPLSTGLLITFALAGTVWDKLSSATSACAALLVGLGIDFVIVSYGRYVEERQRGADASQALELMTGSCGKAVVVGGVTSAATFYAFTVTEFTGLHQMGLLTATGILLCMVAVLVILPALLAWSEARHAKRQSLPTLYVHGFGAAKLVRGAMARPRLTLGLGLAVTVLTAAQLPRLEFESAIQNLRPEGNRGIQVQQEVSERFGSNFKYMMLVLTDPDLDRVLDLATRAAEGARPMLESGDLYRVDSISTLIPSPSRQQEVLAWLEQHRADSLNMDRIRDRFQSALAGEGMRSEPFADGMDLLASALAADTPITVADLETRSSTRRLLERYVRFDGERWKSVVYLYPPENKWKREPPPEAEALAAELGPQAELTGVNVVSRSLRRQVWIDAVIAALLGTLAVTFLLWLDYRRISDTLLSLVPLSVGIVWMLGVMVLLGMKVNFMNIFVTTMIIGIGVDYGVHMLHRRRELIDDGDDDFTSGLAETGQSIAMAAVTTSVGFGSLALSHYPGLRSIGYVAILGAAATALVAITMLPAYLWLKQSENRPPQD